MLKISRGCAGFTIRNVESLPWPLLLLRRLAHAIYRKLTPLLSNVPIHRRARVPFVPDSEKVVAETAAYVQLRACDALSRTSRYWGAGSQLVRRRRNLNKGPTWAHFHRPTSLPLRIPFRALNPRPPCRHPTPRYRTQASAPCCSHTFSSRSGPLRSHALAPPRPAYPWPPVRAPSSGA